LQDASNVVVTVGCTWKWKVESYTAHRDEVGSPEAKGRIGGSPPVKD
jgi:hypothetical protein